MRIPRRTFLTASLASSAVVVLPRDARAGNWAEALFTELKHDFGNVPRGAKVSHKFYLNNRTTEELQLIDVRASCGCTTGQILTPVVPPGKVGVVEAWMDTRNFVGPKPTKLFVTVVSSSGRQAEASLGVMSNILPDIVLNPGSIDFGSVTRGQTPSQTMTIERVDNPNWRFTRMVSASQAIHAQLKEVSRQSNRVAYLLTVGLKPDAVPGLLRDEIQILTNDPGSPVVPVLVTGVVRGALSASPSTLNLGRTASSGVLRGRILVRGAQPFVITGIEGVGEGLAAVADGVERKPAHLVQVEFRPEETSQRGDLKRLLQIQTDLPGEGPLTVPVVLHAGL